MNETTPIYPWHSDYWQKFVGQIQRGILPHAILLHGVKGVGVSSLARAMAEYLLCASPVEQKRCEKCKACQLLASGNHPDLFLLSPDEKSTVIKVDQIRQLSDFVGKTAQQSGRKLVLIDPAEVMNMAAANALLKCLEEPAGETVFILVSHEINRLMPTIRSRCACHVVGIPAHDKAVAWLEEMGVGAADALLRETHGAPLLAHKWWRDDVVKNQQSLCEGLVDSLLGRTPVTAVAARWVGDHSAMDIVEIWLSWLEKLIRVRSKPDQEPLMVSWPALEAANRFLSDAMLFRLHDVYCARKRQLIGNPNLNATMFIEDLLLEWQRQVRVVNKRSLQRTQ